MTRPEVEALSRSMRSRVLLLVLLILGGLAAALWSMTRERGIGEDEDRRKLMIVTRGGDVDYHAIFEAAGFVIEVDDYDDWLAAARRRSPDSEAEGVALLLELADLRGFALVVFERPGELELGELELEPPIADIERYTERDYAAVSVGDYAFPHRLSVDDPGENPVLDLPGYGALQVVFRQELITAREDPDRPTVEELQFEDAISLGRQMFERPAGFAAIVETTRASIDAQYDDGSAARPLVPPLTTGAAIPTPDGGILVLHRELELLSNNARTLRLEPGDRVQVAWISPEAVAGGGLELSPCPTLANGELEVRELEQLRSATDGSALAFGLQPHRFGVWRKVGPGCEWRRIGEQEGGASLELAPGAGEVVGARVNSDEYGSSSVVLTTLQDSGREGAAFERQDLLVQTGRRFSSIAFVDEHHLAVASKRVGVAAASDREERVYLLDQRRPGVYLSVPAEFFADERSIHELLLLAPPTEAAGPNLLIVAQTDRGSFELIRLGVGAQAWEEFSAEPLPEPEPGVEGRMVSLAPAQLDVEIVSELATLYGVAVGPEALIWATSDQREHSELVLRERHSGASRALTGGRNEVGHFLPRVAADGSYVTLVSLTRVDISPDPYRVPRVLALQ